MAGRAVTRSDLDSKMADAILSVRQAFHKVQILNGFISGINTDAPGGDVLTLPLDSGYTADPSAVPGGFGYNADEAYLIRTLFQQLDTLDVKTPLELGRKLTGLE